MIKQTTLHDPQMRAGLAQAPSGLASPDRIVLKKRFSQKLLMDYPMASHYTSGVLVLSCLINVYHVLSIGFSPLTLKPSPGVCQCCTGLSGQTCPRSIEVWYLEAPFHHVGKWMEMAFFTVLSFFPFSFPGPNQKKSQLQGQFGEAGPKMLGVQFYQETWGQARNTFISARMHGRSKPFHIAMSHQAGTGKLRTLFLYLPTEMQ